MSLFAHNWFFFAHFVIVIDLKVAEVLLWRGWCFSIYMGSIVEFEIHILKRKGIGWSTNNNNNKMFEIMLCTTLLFFFLFLKTFWEPWILTNDIRGKMSWKKYLTTLSIQNEYKYFQHRSTLTFGLGCRWSCVPRWYNVAIPCTAFFCPIEHYDIHMG